MNTKKFKFWNRIVALAVFLVAAVTYLLTIEPTASFWDCGEFIASSYKLEVGHPPGNPVFQLFARFATMFTGPEHAAVAVNAMNAILSALTILLLYLTTVFLAKRLFKTEPDGTYSLARSIAIMGSGAVGALAYTFSDTFWFSAVEGEVYAMSSLFTALVFWAMTKWYEQADEPYANRWLALIAFLMGLSIGVHLLNLLTIPALVFLFYYRKREDLEYSFLQLIGIFLVSVVILAVILYGIIPKLPLMAAWFDRFFVNTMGLPFNSGAAFFMLLLLGLCFYGMYVTLKKKKALLNTILLCFTMIVIGFSMFAIVIIRSSVKTPTNEYQPDNPYTLIRYLAREQYGSNPLLYGQAFDSPYELEEETYWAPSVKTTASGEKVYEYVEANAPEVPKYLPEGEMFFPRMWSSVGIDSRKPINHPDVGYYRRDVSPEEDYSHDFISDAGYGNMNPQPGSHVDFYMQYIEDPQWVSYKTDDGRENWFVMPSFTDNLRFFFDYQMNWMYWRYFLWNFAGRQNDFHGQVPHQQLFGNWESGIGFIDEPRLGDQSDAPDYMKNNKGKNHYYMLPLLLGLIGIFFQFARDKRGSWVTFLMFFMTGIAIVIYLNQPPYQVRERDYAYAGSFYSFSIWIGLGVAALYALAVRLFKVFGKTDPQVKRDVAIASAVTCITLGVPVLMASENWDDHDRSNRYTAVEIAKNYLNSVGENGILITHGDNDTFPLWYAQEVEDFRTDVRVVNTSLLGTDWHIDQMRWAANKSAPLDLTLDQTKYLYGTNEYMHIHGIRPRTVANVIEHIKNDDNVLYMVFYHIPKLDKNPKWNPDYRNNPVKQEWAYVGSKKGVPDIRADLLKDDEFCISQNPEYISQKAFIEYLLGRPLEDDDIEIISMSEIGPYVPTHKIIVPVNKDNVIKYGILDEKYADVIPEKIELSISESKGYITKPELFMLDFLARYQWDRPLNMLSMGGDINIGLKEYLMYEGFSYRFVPIRNKTSSSDVGFSDPEDLYYKMKNVYKWDALKRTDYFVDYQNMSTFCGVLPQRQIYVNVAKELLEVGECEKALEMLDMCMECVPVENYPLDMSYLCFSNEYWVKEIAVLYLSLGERDKGLALLEDLVSQLLQSQAFLEELGSAPDEYENLSTEILRILIAYQYDVSTLIGIESDFSSALATFVRHYCTWLPDEDWRTAIELIELLGPGIAMDNIYEKIEEYSDSVKMSLEKAESQKSEYAMRYSDAESMVKSLSAQLDSIAAKAPYADDKLMETLVSEYEELISVRTNEIQYQNESKWYLDNAMENIKDLKHELAVLQKLEEVVLPNYIHYCAAMAGTCESGSEALSSYKQEALKLFEFYMPLIVPAGCTFDDAEVWMDVFRHAFALDQGSKVASELPLYMEYQSDLMIDSMDYLDTYEKYLSELNSELNYDEKATISGEKAKYEVAKALYFDVQDFVELLKIADEKAQPVVKQYVADVEDILRSLYQTSYLSASRLHDQIDEYDSYDLEERYALWNQLLENSERVYLRDIPKLCDKYGLEME